MKKSKIILIVFLVLAALATIILDLPQVVLVADEVKNVFRDLTTIPGNPLIPVAADAPFKLLRASVPDAVELENNPRARSAHMRGVQKSY